MRENLSRGSTSFTKSHAHSDEPREFESHENWDTSPAFPEELPDPDAQGNSDLVEYPTGLARGLIFSSLAISVFLVALDSTILATAIPKITDEFQSQNDIGWYGSSYLLAQLSVQLLYGKLYSYLSKKLVFLVAVGIFEAGSLLCGAAPSSKAFITGRAIAGAGGAGIVCGSMIIIAQTVPLRQRPIFAGLLGTMYGVATVVAPLVGGVFTDKVTWRLCFYLNLPIGAVAIGGMIFFFRPRRGRNVAIISWRDCLREMDIPGTAVLIPAVISLIMALQYGGAAYPWSNWRVILLLVFAGVLTSVWLFLQYWQDERSTIPPRFLKNVPFSGALWFQFCLGCYFFLYIYYVPIWFQTVQSTTAIQSGIRSLPMILGLALVSLASGAAVSYFGYFLPFMLASLIFTSVGAGLLLTWTPTSSTGLWVGSELLIGLGIGLGVQMPLIIVQQVCSSGDIPTGTTLMYFVQNAGGAIFLAVGQNAFANELKKEIVRRLPKLDPQIIVQTGATELQTRVSAADKPQLALAYNESLRQCFLAALVLSCVTLPGIVFVGRQKMGSGERPAEDEGAEEIIEMI